MCRNSCQPIIQNLYSISTFLKNKPQNSGPRFIAEGRLRFDHLPISLVTDSHNTTVGGKKRVTKSLTLGIFYNTARLRSLLQTS